MTDLDLATKARDGDAWAVNELLRRALPGVRSIIRKSIFRSSTTYDVYDDAVSEGLLAVWRSIPAWVKDPRASLVTFARRPILRAAKRVASDFGHAVLVPEDECEATQDARRNAVQRARGMTEPVGEFTYLLTYEDMLAAPPVPVEERIDVARLLDCIDEQGATVLWRSACGDTFEEIGSDLGATKQWAYVLHTRAIKRTRRAAAPFKKAA